MQGIYLWSASHHGEDDIEEGRGGEHEEQQGEDQGPHEQLIHVILAGVHPLPQHIPLLALEEAGEGQQGRHLEAVDPEIAATDHISWVESQKGAITI